MEIKRDKSVARADAEYELVELEIEDKKKGKVRLVRSVRRTGVAKWPGIDSATGCHTRIANARGSRRAPAPASRSSRSRHSSLRRIRRLIPEPDGRDVLSRGVARCRILRGRRGHVRKGQALCIIEAMKMMNEIEAEIGGPRG